MCAPPKKPSRKPRAWCPASRAKNSPRGVLVLAGVRRENDARLMRAQLQPVANGLPWVLETDAVAAHRGAFDGKTGLVLSVGTGAICLGIDEGERFYGDGWGPLLGDEGSGYWMGLEAIRTVCRAHDGRAPRTALTQAVLSELRLNEAPQLIPLLQGGKLEPERIAELARVILIEAETGVEQRHRNPRTRHRLSFSHGWFGHTRDAFAPPRPRRARRRAQH